jgi:tetratricopeptide (TPR) repeat protein
MGRHDWYRRTTWTREDAAEFQARLARSRGDTSKAQYLRIQALYLAEAGLHEPALSLMEQLLTNHAVRRELASTHLQRAKSFAAIGRNAEAVESFRSSLVAQRDYPTIRTNVELEFAWFIVVGQHVSLYAEVEPLLQQYMKEVGLLFPVQRYKCAVVLALLAWEQGRSTEALKFVFEARKAASKQHSGFRYHAKFGLVSAIPNEVAQRLTVIDGV